MPIKEHVFGHHNGQTIKQFVATNNNGISIAIMEYGATITDISIPSDDGKSRHIACGFDRLESYFSHEYAANAPYFGCTVGRYASRIKDGRYTINGIEYQGVVNDGSNHLHGGKVGFDKKVWAGEVIEEGDQEKIKMTLTSLDGDEGYPGLVTVQVYFHLTDQNEIHINYHATTDQSTPLSLTNHTYFNLSGFTSDIKNHGAQIVADSFLAPDETNVPVGEILDVSGRVEDLRVAKKLGDCFEKLSTGFEHYYVFDPSRNKEAVVARFLDVDSEIELEISTSEPGTLFYTGYFTSNDLAREQGDQFGRYRAFCFETSRYPNGPNIPSSPDSVTHPDKPFESQTIFKIKI